MYCQLQEKKIHSVRGGFYTNRLNGFPMRKYPENNIRKMRSDAGLTLGQLAERIHPETSGDMIRKIETGERELTLGWMNKISTALRCKPFDLVNKEEPEEEKIFKADDDLMERAAQAITKAIASSKKKYTLAEAMVATVKLYNHVLEYRQKGEVIEPSESIAALLLQHNG